MVPQMAVIRWTPDMLVDSIEDADDIGGARSKQSTMKSSSAGAA
jgi:hypothetical protein